MRRKMQAFSAFAMRRWVSGVHAAHSGLRAAGFAASQKAV
jgi:hypothetical protein